MAAVAQAVMRTAPVHMRTTLATASTSLSETGYLGASMPLLDTATCEEHTVHRSFLLAGKMAGYSVCCTYIAVDKAGSGGD